MSTDTATPAHRRHDISDRAWKTHRAAPPGGPGKYEAAFGGGRHGMPVRMAVTAGQWPTVPRRRR